MNRFNKILLSFLLCIFFSASINAEKKSDSIQANFESQLDSLATSIDSINLESNDSAKNASSWDSFINKLPSWSQEYIRSLFTGNVDRTFEKKVDMSWGIIPSYGREASFGLLGAATGQYRVNRQDSTLSPSDFTISLNATLNGFFVLDIYGNHLFSDHKSRISYDIELYRKRLEFWGLTVDESTKNQMSQYDRRQINFHAQYIYDINDKFYVGGVLQANYTDAVNVLNPEYMLGYQNQFFVTGAGLSLGFDTRDHLVTPTKGIHILYQPMIFPKFLGNAGVTFHSHKFIFDGYFKMWKGSVLAVDLYTKFNSKNVPWTMREMIAADGVRMRGYYMGSIIDNNQIAAQIEYRQQIWKRLGAVVWGGYSTLFPDFDALKNYKDLHFFPNYGVGLRFEFKNKVNIRADYGFGKNTSGLIVTIGEAF